MGRLFWKFFLASWLALVFAAISAASVVWLQHRAHDQIRGELAMGHPHEIAVDLAATTLQWGGVNAVRRWMEEVERTRKLPLYVVDASGRDLTGRPVSPETIAQARRVATEAGEKGAARAVTIEGQEYLLFVPRSGAHMTPLPPFPWWHLILGTVASVVVSALLAWYMARPIGWLRAAFDSAANGNLDARVGERIGRRRDEIADLGRDFDRMAEQLQRLMAAQRRLLHDVSHELRSPLARLQAAVGLARQDPEELERSLRRIEREAVRLNELVGELLTLARLDSGAIGGLPEPVDLAEVVAEVVDDAKFEAEAAGRRVVLRSADHAPMVARTQLLQRAFDNVLRNAIRYTPAGTAVKVDLEAGNGAHSAVLTVTDQGEGMRDDELARVFQPFFRASGAPPGEGFGLGLAIACRAVEVHGGTIAAANVEGGGLRVRIELPLAEAVQRTDAARVQ